MARVKWKKDGERLHGTLCGVVYRVVNGKQHAHIAAPASDHRGRTVQECVRVIQCHALERTASKAEDRQRIADEYPAIKKAVERMYEDFAPMFSPDDRKLQEAIVYWYEFKKLPPEFALFVDELPTEYREWPDIPPTKSDKKVES